MITLFGIGLYLLHRREKRILAKYGFIEGASPSPEGSPSMSPEIPEEDVADMINMTKWAEYDKPKEQ
jgi:hypothetical protein